MTETIRLSHSSGTQMNLCPRRVLFESKLRLFSINGDMSLRYGQGYHKAQEAYYKHGKNITKGLEAAVEFWNKPTKQIYDEADYRNIQSLCTALMQYDERYRLDLEAMTGEPETKVIATILLTDEEKAIYGDIEVNFVEVIDLILEIDGCKWITDFKTTKSDLPYMASMLRKMVQLMGYHYVAQRLFPDVSGCLVDYHQIKAVKSRSTGFYGETKIDFMKFPMIFPSHDYKNWRRYVIWNAAKFRIAEKAGYPPEAGSCYAFNKTCPYLPLCEYPKWDIDRFMEMKGFVVVPDDREHKEAIRVIMPMA
jgi:hypothetical protein